MMFSAAKQPKSKPIKDPQKQPKIRPIQSYNDQCPAWRISLLQMASPFGWQEIGHEKLNEIRQKLSQFEAKSWSEILIKDKHWNHTISVDDLCKDAQDRLVQIDQDDVEELISLRLSGSERIWGIRDRDILKILWWDPDHQVCPSPKKHT